MTSNIYIGYRVIHKASCDKDMVVIIMYILLPTGIQSYGSIYYIPSTYILYLILDILVPKFTIQLIEATELKF